MEHADLHFSPQRTTTNLYIVLIAVSDLLSAILVMPLVGGVLVAVRLVFGDVVCQFHVFFSRQLVCDLCFSSYHVFDGHQPLCEDEQTRQTGTEYGFPRRPLRSWRLFGFLLH